jgi:hypothetical protein
MLARLHRASRGDVLSPRFAFALIVCGMLPFATHYLAAFLLVGALPVRKWRQNALETSR